MAVLGGGRFLMSELPLYCMAGEAEGGGARGGRAVAGSLRSSENATLGPYSRHMRRALWRS